MWWVFPPVSCWHTGIIRHSFWHGIAIGSISNTISNHLSSCYYKDITVAHPFRLGLGLLLHYLEFDHLNSVQLTSHCFSNLLSSFWTLNLSSMSSPVFILFRRLNSSTNLMSLFTIPFSRSLKKHLGSPGTQGDPFKTSLVMSPQADT